jgi:hypothetical protein
VNSDIYIPSAKYLQIIVENAEKEMIDAATLDHLMRRVFSENNVHEQYLTNTIDKVTLQAFVKSPEENKDTNNKD